MADFDSRLIELFRGEIEYLRKSGAEFGARYPKIAGRLELSGQESSDPQIERLLESFAFLTARIQTRIDDQHAEIPAAMLGVLHPYLIDPIPPMSSVCFRATENKQPPPSGRIVPRGTPLYAESGQGDFCRFRTCYNVDIRPIQIYDASIEPVSNYQYFDTSKVGSVLAIKIKGLGLPMSDIPIKIYGYICLVIGRLAWICTNYLFLMLFRLFF
jgi:type VI secretion system protein ImpG